MCVDPTDTHMVLEGMLFELDHNKTLSKFEGPFGPSLCIVWLGLGYHGFSPQRQVCINHKYKIQI